MKSMRPPFGSHLFTIRNKVAKVMFSHLSVILFTGGGLPQCMLGYAPQEQTPPTDQGTLLGADPPRTRHTPQEQTPHPGSRPPLDQAPPGPGTPGTRHPLPLADGYCCGRYVSYWNAFLLTTYFYMAPLPPLPDPLLPEPGMDPGFLTLIPEGSASILSGQFFPKKETAQNQNEVSQYPFHWLINYSAIPHPVITCSVEKP